MCLVSVKDFGSALNISGGTIRSKISRGQLRCNKNKLIDTENPVNYSYLLEVNGGNQEVFSEYDVKQKSKTNVIRKVVENTNILKNISSVVETPAKSSLDSGNDDFENTNKINGSVNIAPTVKPKKTTSKKEEEIVPKISAEDKRRQIEDAKARRDLLDYDMRKKKADAEYREREAELKRMQLEKLAGNTLPLDMTKRILHINCQAILIQFLASVENMVGITVEELGGTRADNVRITTELKNVFKKTVENCSKNAEREIEVAVAEYSELRSRGERKA